MNLPVISNLACRYARALYETADGPGARAELEKILGRLAEACRAHPELRIVCGNTALPAAWRTEFLLELAGVARESPGGRMAELLVSRKRLNLLPEIMEAWHALERADAGLTQVLVETPAPMPESERQSLARRLAAILGQKVELDWAVKPDLLGGLVLYYNGRIVDGSIRGRLRAAREALLARQTLIA